METGLPNGSDYKRQRGHTALACTWPRNWTMRGALGLRDKASWPREEDTCELRWKM